MVKGLACATRVALFLCLSMLVVGSVGDLVQTTCSKTRYYDLCLSTLQSDLRSSKASVKGLAQIALNVAHVKSNDTLYYFVSLLPGEGSQVHYRSYGTCIDNYAGIVNRLIPWASTDLANNQFVEAKENADIAATNAQACEDQFVSEPSPATTQNKAAHDIATVAADIIGTLG